MSWNNQDRTSHCGMVIRALLSHVIEHPDAKDTVEGIHKFWFPKDSPIPSRKKVEEALQLMVNKRWFIVRKTSAFETVYSLNKEFLEEMKNVLRDLS
jgi:hypothetical protein